jgi:hypothetical protein
LQQLLPPHPELLPLPAPQQQVLQVLQPRT